MNENTLNNVAKTLNVTVDVLREKALTVLDEQAPAWRNAGKSEEDCGLLAIRVAARSISTENARLSRSGATKYEGMFISSPRPKEWGKILYSKMKNHLMRIIFYTQIIIFIQLYYIVKKEKEHLLKVMEI